MATTKRRRRRPRGSDRRQSGRLRNGGRKSTGKWKRKEKR
ncbi:unnamed protein product [Acanthoscelides obtectus]|uniref:Uncharacterized protein n=1 Tax=Acanthoscelides obtectus TaxID=200917 RepID=A0A9P0PNZ0_ACAOB|nr:unnamed protein product [Acanthoscelides obtectus]CAK1626556.1 hypothetical protein AOBTE_LOCUS3927 [Acanthoscelides obtectus]